MKSLSSRFFATAIVSCLATFMLTGETFAQSGSRNSAPSFAPQRSFQSAPSIAPQRSFQSAPQQVFQAPQQFSSPSFSSPSFSSQGFSSSPNYNSYSTGSISSYQSCPQYSSGPVRSYGYVARPSFGRGFIAPSNSFRYRRSYSSCGGY